MKKDLSLAKENVWSQGPRSIIRIEGVKGFGS